MAVKIQIPTPLRPYVNNQDEVSVEGNGSVKNIIDSLVNDNDQLKKNLLDNEGTLRKFVNVYLNYEDIRDLNGPDSEVKDGDVISIVPSIAGGAR